MLKRNLLIAGLLLGAASTSQASIAFDFDMNGAAAGGAVTATAFDWNVGSALAVNGNPAGGLAPGDTVTLLYQANLSVVNLFGGGTAGNGSSGTYFTAVAGFQETATAVFGNTAFFQATAADLLAPSFFYIYANTTGEADNLNGTGFTLGTRIFEATLQSVDSIFSITSTTPTLFDQSVSDDWSGQLTLPGLGSTQIGALVNFIDTNYFLDTAFLNALITTAFNTSLVDPFREVDPSKCFSMTGLADCTYQVFSAGKLGPVNGNPLGHDLTNFDFQFQADGTTSLTAVPEPGSLALLGLGLGALGMFQWRRGQRMA